MRPGWCRAVKTETLLPVRLVGLASQGMIMTKNRLVSVVDDDESIRESLPDLLRLFDLEVEPYSSAEEFLAAGGPERTACLVLDISMPGMSGLELQLELGRQGWTVPIVFITSHPDETVASLVVKRGAVACLFKPFSQAAILEAVGAALGKS
jgi:FixJ family two-component response regulator